MFFWCYQVLLTNSFIVYKKYMLMHKQKPISRYEFNKAIALAWVDPASQYTLRKKETKCQIYIYLCCNIIN